jgi:alanyl-tRNA synthetase
MGVRKQVDRMGMLRAIEIAGIDLQPCGGTHLRRTGQIGTILLGACTKVRQDWRVEFLCGHRAERAARRDADLVARVCARLKCAPHDLDASVARLLQEWDSALRNFKSLLPKLADADAATRLGAITASDDGSRSVTEVLLDVAPEYLQFYATALVRSENVVALLAVQETGALLFAQNPGVGKDMNAVLREVLNRLGGKGGGTKDFARGALTDPAKASEALSLAERLIHR